MKNITNHNNLILLLSVVVIYFIAIDFVVVIRNTNTLINAYDRYNKNCEILLDSIAEWDETFEDKVTETDTYVIYLESREHLDSVIYNK